MSNIQKKHDNNIANKGADNGKIKLDGKLGVGLEITPWVVKGRAAIGVFFQLPTLLATDLLKKINERLKQSQNDQ